MPPSPAGSLAATAHAAPSTPVSAPPEVSSKDLMAATGISRATLNNYVALGLLPQPAVKVLTGSGRTRRLGFFPKTAIETVRRVQALKSQGRTLDSIVQEVARPDAGPQTPPPAPEVAAPPPPAAGPAKPRTSPPGAAGWGGLDLDAIEHPAYMINNRLELEWWNPAAEHQLLQRPASDMPSDITERGLFGLLDRRSDLPGAEDWEELVRFHLSCAKSRLPQSIVYTLCAHLSKRNAGLVFEAYNRVGAANRSGLAHTDVNLAVADEEPRWFRIYAAFFREGIFFVYVPARDPSDQWLGLLGRRDQVIRELLRRRRPYLTPLAVVVADLEDSSRICVELPPEEYFEMVNGIWRAMEPLLRKYHATHGKHVGDGMLYYFFPQPDSNYVDNAIRCAQEMREVIRKVDISWRARKNWNNDLVLNIGLDEGQEWFGAYQTPTHLEFAALGDTINRASRLSDFAQGGAIWCTKNLLNKLSHEERREIRFGINRHQQGESTLIPGTFARLGNLLDLDDPRNFKLRDLSTVAVTEIMLS
ncbi:adenylate/guanylate cyclase domain-containing protein [Roseospirillum parvum]|uniref:Adenylate and Guanylate cyclase catalytic domain-containing protein n=1 Tax=Roseospirillum parvum TaxID=83401 RepID=A0A1G7Y4M5_9PROT|nr:adenylate/guanylate cyclase domain-containing protein [Roseospirillum parvum]SDG91216.1 Adenylate and Guanylate cyclase catalytic domain-containing protein [Roseospirillum parvum]